MARKTKSKPEPRLGEDITSAEKGDYCYYLNGSNKVGFAEVQKVFEEGNHLIIQVICQTDYKFISLPSEVCSFDEKTLKGKKRKDLCPGVYGEQ